jgi:glycerol-3-phosphate responsive antiterminator
MSRLFRFFIKDRAAFASSIQQIADLPIDRIVVAHGEPIVQDAKATLMNTLTKHGLAP